MEAMIQVMEAIIQPTSSLGIRRSAPYRMTAPRVVGAAQALPEGK
jgi:hypothetical protein